MYTTDTQLPTDLADETPDECELAPLTWKERGMVTAEYVVGIIAAISLALVMLKVFKADTFFTWIFDIIKDIFGTITGLIS